MNESNTQPDRLSITVVIPTIGRPSLAGAIDSILRQTVGVDEILVCSDTAAQLSVPNDERIRIIQVGPGAGGNGARRAGMAQAKSELIALLDDDDWWEPTFIEETTATVPITRGAEDAWVASSRGNLPNGKQFPERLFTGRESLLDYLFTLKGGPGNKGALPTSTLIFPKSLVDKYPWRAELRFHQDVTWLVDLSQKCKELEIFQSPVRLVSFGDSPGSITKSIRIGESVAWAQNELLALPRGQGRQAFADFMLSRYPFRAAVNSQHWRQAGSIARIAVLKGKPSIWAIIFAFAYAGKGAFRHS